MFIIPISSAITPLNTMSQNTAAVSDNTEKPSFADVFKEVYQETQDAQDVLDRSAADIVMGNIDDLHTVYNNITKAEISLQTLVAIRDAAQQSYKELMQMSV